MGVPTSPTISGILVLLYLLAEQLIHSRLIMILLYADSG